MSFWLLSLLPPLALFAAAWIFRLRWMWPLEKAAARIAAASPAAACGLCALAGLTTALCLSSFVRIPVPAVHDEFAYLLAADTFSRGRLTNPVHPLWPYFETLHVLSLPSYSSKYPPGQGLMLALGQALGDPVIGLWLETAVVCAAMCWMLQAWFPRRWALLGGLLTAFHPLILKWCQMFWGGSVQLTGAALACGAARRLIGPNRKPADSAMFALGIAILANSRPFEGAVLTLLLIAATGWNIRGDARGLWPCPTAGERIHTAEHSPNSLPRGFRLWTPGLIVLLAVGLWMAYFNFRVTGVPWRMPYMVHEAEYWVAPVLLFQPMRDHIPPMMRYDSMKGVAVGWAIPNYADQKASLGSLLHFSWDKCVIAGRNALQVWDLSAYGFDPGSTAVHTPLLFFLRYLMLGPILALPVALRRERPLRWALGGLILFLLATMADTNMHPHYAAPGGALLTILLVAGLRYLRAWRPKIAAPSARNRRFGRSLARLLVLLYVAAFARYAWEFALPRWNHRPPDRAPIIDFLHQHPGKHIVFVYYGVPYKPAMEWVYNGADIDGQDIIWARYLGPERTAIALKYYSDRTPWFLDLSKEPLQMTVYSKAPHPPMIDSVTNPVRLDPKLVGQNAVWPAGWEVPVHSGLPADADFPALVGSTAKESR